MDDPLRLSPPPPQFPGAGSSADGQSPLPAPPGPSEPSQLPPKRSVQSRPSQGVAGPSTGDDDDALPVAAVPKTVGPYRCPNEPCTKAYASELGLRYHSLRCDGGKAAAARPIGCPFGPDCDKRFKQLNGLRYHVVHAHQASFTAIAALDHDLAVQLEGTSNFLSRDLADFKNQTKSKAGRGRR